MKKVMIALFSLMLIVPNIVNASQCKIDNPDSVGDLIATFDRFDNLSDSRKEAQEQYGDSSQYTIVCCDTTNPVCEVYKVKNTNTDTTTTTTNNNNNNNNNNISYCKGLNSTFKFIGHIVAIAKILIPILIIGLGIMDFFKAMVASKDDEIKKSTRSLIFRCIAGVIIFFLPYFIDLIFSWVSDFESYQEQSEECWRCIWNVDKC